MIRILNVSPETSLNELAEKLKEFEDLNWIQRNKFKDFEGINITDGTISVRLALHHGKSIPAFYYKEQTDESDAEVWQLKYNGKGKTGCRKGGGLKPHWQLLQENLQKKV